MIDMVRITEILRLFLTFNYVEGSDSLNFEHNEYNDKFFRWTKDTFSHKEKFCVVFNDESIKMFDRVKVMDRLKANLEKIKSSPDKVNHGCKMDVVKDLVMIIPITELTDDDILEIDAALVRIEEYQKRKSEELLTQAKADPKKFGTGHEKGSKLTNRIK